MIANFDRTCVNDETFEKLKNYASGLDPNHVQRKYGIVAGGIAGWISSIMAYSKALRESANDRAEMDRLTQRLEDQYHQEDDYFDEVNEDDLYDENRYSQESGWA